MDMNQYTLFLPLDEKFESEELSPAYIVRLLYSRISSIKQLSFFLSGIFNINNKQTISMMHAYHMFDKLTIYKDSHVVYYLICFPFTCNYMYCQ